jgi:hypothetical protein
VAAVIERTHQAAVKDALAFIEGHALLTRTGPHGIRQVNVRGLVGAAFTHRDSRAGDPDLHTHVAVANKVQTLDGRWWVCQSDLAPLGGLVLARCGPTLDQSFPFTFGSSARAIRRGEGLEGEIESGAV